VAVTSRFNPLNTMRAIRDDLALDSAGKKSFLLCAALRTNNETSRVRASQQMLAEDASINVRTVRRYMEDPEVAKYFHVQRLARAVNLTWRPLGMGDPSEAEGLFGHPVHTTGHGDTDSGHEVSPSTSSSTPTSTKDEFGDEDKEETQEDPASPLPTSTRGPAELSGDVCLLSPNAVEPPPDTMSSETGLDVEAITAAIHAKTGANESRLKQAALELALDISFEPARRETRERAAVAVITARGRALRANAAASRHHDVDEADERRRYVAAHRRATLEALVDAREEQARQQSDYDADVWRAAKRDVFRDSWRRDLADPESRLEAALEANNDEW
jgi:hypothetical protein